MTTTDIAKTASVSQATVSRVLNGNSNVSPEMVARVEKAMKDLGYRPSAPRRATQPTRRAQVGLVAALLLSRDQFQGYASSYGFMLQGAAEALSAENIGLLTAPVLRGRQMTPDQLPDLVLDRKVDGLLLMGHHPLKETLKVLEGIPRVWTTSHNEESGDVALAGNERVGEIAADFLAKRGHTSLGVLDTTSAFPSTQRRCNYFKFQAQQLGLPVQEFMLTAGATTQETLDLQLLEERVEQAVDQFIAAENRPTGLFVPMDLQLAMVQRVLIKRGLKVGRKGDVELIGSDDEKAALIGLSPRPATISISASTMGSRAASQLLWRIRNAHVPERMRVIIEPELILGDEG